MPVHSELTGCLKDVKEIHFYNIFKFFHRDSGYRTGLMLGQPVPFLKEDGRKILLLNVVI